MTRVPSVHFASGRIFDQAILQVLVEISVITLRIAEDTSPRAHRLLTGVARGEPEKDMAEDVLAILDVQKDILADFRQLDLKMQKWESYAELIEELIRIKKLEAGIRQGADRLKKDK